MKYKVIYMPFQVNGIPIEGIKGCIEWDPEYPEEYTMYIDSILPEDIQAETLKHELKHIELDHFKRIQSGDITLSEAEIEAHSSIKKEPQTAANSL